MDMVTMDITMGMAIVIVTEEREGRTTRVIIQTNGY